MSALREIQLDRAKRICNHRMPRTPENMAGIRRLRPGKTVRVGEKKEGVELQLRAADRFIFPSVELHIRRSIEMKIEMVRRGEEVDRNGLPLRSEQYYREWLAEEKAKKLPNFDRAAWFHEMVKDAREKRGRYSIALLRIYEGRNPVEKLEDLGEVQTIDGHTIILGVKATPEVRAILDVWNFNVVPIGGVPYEVNREGTIRLWERAATWNVKTPLGHETPFWFEVVDPALGERIAKEFGKNLLAKGINCFATGKFHGWEKGMVVGDSRQDLAGRTKEEKWGLVLEVTKGSSQTKTTPTALQIAVEIHETGGETLH